MAKMTQTMRVLLARRNGADSIACTGIRETNAARALVAQGLAARYESHAKIIPSRRYWDNFGKCYKWTRETVDIGGVLYFNV